MNPDTHPDYKGLYRSVVARFKKVRWLCSGPLDETFYTMLVFKASKDLARKVRVEVDVPVLLCASLLHDIGKTALDAKKIIKNDGFFSTKASRRHWRTHPARGVPLARTMLRGLGHSERFIERVCHIVGHHDKRDGSADCMELKILQDADIIADAGLTGFVRSFNYAGTFRRPMLGTLKYLRDTPSRAGETFFNLGISKKIAKDKVKREQALIKELSAHVDWGLLDE